MGCGVCVLLKIVDIDVQLNIREKTRKSRNKTNPEKYVRFLW